MKLKSYEAVWFKHDIRYHLDMINTYMDQGDLKGAQIYLRKTTNQLDKSNQEISVTENMTVNAVIPLNFFPFFFTRSRGYFEKYISSIYTFPCSLISL